MLNHPGAISFVDVDTGVESVQSIDQVPKSIAFYTDTGGERIPVVCVVKSSDGSNIRVQTFGANGNLLQTTLMAPSAPWKRNVLPRNLSPNSLLTATQAGELRWARSAKNPVVQAGGRVPEGLHAGHEIWIALARLGKEYQLTLTSEMQPYGEPIRQRDGWFRRCELGSLWVAVEASIGP